MATLRLLILVVCALLAAVQPVVGAETSRPNILLILCDDLGYGDVKCLNPDGKIATPNMDRIAREGMIFTDAHVVGRMFADAVRTDDRTVQLA